MDNSSGAGSAEDMVVFVAVAEAQGFSAAARRLGVSKAMVSASIARLERRLGIRLFHRTTRRLSLTESGQAALPHAQAAWAALQQAEDAATRLRSSPRGTLRISAPMSFGTLHIAPLLPAFATRYPEVTIDLVLDDRVVDLVDGGFDLAIRIGDLADSSVVATRIGTNRSVIAAAPAYLEQAPALEHPQDLAAHRCLVYTLSATGARWHFARDGVTFVAEIVSRFRVNNSLAIRRALIEGAGVARVPRFLVHEDLASGRLVRLLQAWALPEQGIYIATPTRRYPPLKLTAFVDYLRQQFAERPYREETR